MPHDLIRVVEAAYAPAEDDTSWLRQVLLELQPRFDAGMGVIAYEVSLSRPGGTRGISTECGQVPPNWRTTSHAMNTLMSAGVHKRFYQNPSPAGTVSSRLGRRGMRETRALREEFWAPDGIRDAKGVIIHDGGPRLLSIVAASARLETIDRTERWRLARAAAHLAAGLRLRRNSPRDEAVLLPDGRVLHAEGASRAPDVRARLRELAQRIDRARARLRRTDPDDALDLWRVLCDGRWSLVESFESDGRRFYLARDNAPHALGAEPLSPDERRVAALVAMGKPIKLIAYELGLTPSAVSAQVRAALAKLGLGSRAELVRLYSAASSAG